MACRDNIVKYISNIWWTLQGIIISGWGLVGLFAEYNNVYAELLLAGLFLIVFTILKNNRSYNIRILSQICLILYTIITSIIIFYVGSCCKSKGMVCPSSIDNRDFKYLNIHC